MKTEAKQKQSQEDYHIACQHCGTTDQPLHIIPLRNDKHVVGLIHCCDECHDDVKGQPFDKINATQKQESAQVRYDKAVAHIKNHNNSGEWFVTLDAIKIAAGLNTE